MEVAIECGACAAIQLVRTLSVRDPDWRRHVGPLLAVAGEALARADNPGAMLTAMYDAVKAAVGDEDPYRAAKDAADARAEAWWAAHSLPLADLAGRLALAAAANAIDAGLDPSLDPLWASFEAAATEPPAHDDRPAVLAWLDAHPGAHVVYLLDNAGEAVFDREVLRALQARGFALTAVVKGGPILNDVTRREARAIGLDTVATVVDNGTDCSGVLPGRVAPRVERLLETADLIVAKGLAHLETLSHRDLAAPVVFAYRAKCPPSARLLSVPEQATVVWFRPPQAKVSASS
ncbi:MAG: ARMT1-like domain-containing protein [Actinomycetia bacterium]|nr:ARMT1-like domain-containing protein [Actinomycetes bacterium]